MNAHFQNGIAERTIWDLTKSARKRLLHARACWLAVVHFALWSYALRNATLLHNNLPVLEDGTSRLELFSSIWVGCNMKHVHTFVCPVCALQNALALGKLLSKWSPHARLGLNLGPRPTQARNVYLVLNLMTRCVSPQYHCWFDDFFETTHHGVTSNSLDDFSVPKVDFDIMIDYKSYTDGESEATWSPWKSRTSWASQQAEGVTPIEPTVKVGTGRSGRVCTLSRKMAKSTS